MSDRYLEAHVTVKAELHDTLTFTKLSEIGRRFGWKASTFEVDEVDDATGMWFLSYRCEDENQIFNEVVEIYHAVETTGFKITRWKVERTLADSKLGDSLLDFI